MALLFYVLAAVSAPEMQGLLRPHERPLVVHVWASWCAPCLAELPELAMGLRKRAARADALFIDLDAKPEAAARVLSRVKLPGRSVRPASPEAAAALHQLDEKWEGDLPATWLLAPDGSVILAQRGVSDLGELWKQIDQPRRREK